MSRRLSKQVDASFRDRWAEQKLVPAAPASELAVMRRLSLVALRLGPVAGGDPPVRGQAQGRAGRSLARRPACATAAVPTTWPSGSPAPSSAPRTGHSCCIRRRRFIAWLSDALLENRPYDALVTD